MKTRSDLTTWDKVILAGLAVICIWGFGTFLLGVYITGKCLGKYYFMP